MSRNIKCAFCSGKGKDPFNLLSSASVCLVCNGTGQVEIAEPIRKCVFCAGTGINPLGALNGWILHLSKFYKYLS